MPVVVINILINKYAGEYFNDLALRVSGSYVLTRLSFFISEILIGVLPAELFRMIYKSKGWKEFLLIVLSLGIISSLCGFIALLAGKYLNEAKIATMVVLQKKFKRYGDLFFEIRMVNNHTCSHHAFTFCFGMFYCGIFKIFSFNIFKRLWCLFKLSGFLFQYISKSTVLLYF